MTNGLHDTHAVLQWHLDAGVDETIAHAPIDRLSRPKPAKTEAIAPPAPAPKAASRPHTGPPPTLPLKGQAKAALPPAGEAAVKSAVAAAAAAGSVAELHQALQGFDGCGLKKTATNLVFTDGNPEALVMFIGEGPGAEEDRQGLPFVGPSGKLLDAMLASIGLDRTKVMISNTVFWRPPGNRTPTPQEAAVCQPFIERLIEIVDPKILVALGGPAAKSLLGETQGVGRLRGRWFTYQTPRLSHPIDATAMFHPAYLLRTPAQKRAAWQDLRAIRRKLLD